MSRCLYLLPLFLLAPVSAEVKVASATGFQTVTTCTIDVSADLAYQTLIHDFSTWYDASHSYSGQPKNLSLDLEKACMLERLPDGGYVRHMEIVYHQPDKMLRMTGGLGPLQGMGVAGALSFAFSETDGKTTVTLTYNVSGADFLQLDKIAAPVDGVLTSQLKRFEAHCRKVNQAK
ncbi:MAG: hypothetical protein NXI04_16385 [Planctomycetaceae bacterium]|nr:hypothetical protein [Planctomycetaceae bacterium]